MTGALPKATTIRKVFLTLAALIAYFLPGHLVIMALLVFVWAMAMINTTGTAQTRATQARVANLVSAVGGINSQLGNFLPISGGTITGSLTVNGNMTVISALGVHGGTTLIGSSSCSNDFTVGGNFTADNTATILGSCGVHGDCNIIGRIGSNYNMPQVEPVGQGQPPTGTGGPSQYAGNFFTGSAAHTWAVNISNLMNTVIISLHNAGVYT